MVDKRTLEKYEREAKKNGRELWCVSILLLFLPYATAQCAKKRGHKSIVYLDICLERQTQTMRSAKTTKRSRSDARILKRGESILRSLTRPVTSRLCRI